MPGQARSPGRRALPPWRGRLPARPGARVSEPELAGLDGAQGAARHAGDWRRARHVAAPGVPLQPLHWPRRRSRSRSGRSRSGLWLSSDLVAY